MEVHTAAAVGIDAIPLDWLPEGITLCCGGASLRPGTASRTPRCIEVRLRGPQGLHAVCTGLTGALVVVTIRAPWTGMTIRGNLTRDGEGVVFEDLDGVHRARLRRDEEGRIQIEGLTGPTEWRFTVGF